MKISINTSTFAEYDRTPLLKLEGAKIDFSLNPFKRTLKEEEVIQQSALAVGIIAGTEPLSQGVLSRLPQLKVISRCGVGQDNIDLTYAQKKGIKIFTTPQGPTDAVAELTVGLILNLLRKVNLMDQELKTGKWQKHMGCLLQGKKVGIVGFGRIGQKVAKLLAPFSVEIGMYDVAGNSQPGITKFNDLKSLLSWADIVTLHVAADNQSGALIDAAQIKQMKQGSWLINMSRGGMVEEKALYDALVSNHLAGAALDVFTQEPYQGPLTNLKQVILTPHIGSYAKEARVQMEMEAVENLLKGLNKIKEP